MAKDIFTTRKVVTSTTSDWATPAPPDTPVRPLFLTRRPSVRLFVRPSLCPSVRPSVHPFVHRSVHWLVTLELKTRKMRIYDIAVCIMSVGGGLDAPAHPFATILWPRFTCSQFLYTLHVILKLSELLPPQLPFFPFLLFCCVHVQALSFGWYKKT